MRNKLIKTKALRMAVIYLILGGIWIFATDSLLVYLANEDMDIFIMFQTYKGSIFVILTAILFYILIRHSLEHQYKILERLLTSEQRYRNLTKFAPVGIYHADDKGMLTYVNPRAEEIMDMFASDCLGEGWATTLHEDDRERVYASWKHAASNGAIFRDEYRYKHKDGKVIWVVEEGRPEFNEKGCLVGYLGTITDVTRQREEEERMRLYAAAFENTHEGVMITDPEGKIVSVNRAFCEVTGYTEVEVLNQKSGMLSSTEQDSEFYENMWKNLMQTGAWQGEIRNRRKNGEVYPEWLSISVLFDKNNKPTHCVGVFSDITKLKQTEQELEQLAHYDALTKLPNRLLLQSRLVHAIEQAPRRGGHLAMLFIDLDDFKKVNDSLGHTAGDELLVAVAERLHKRVRAEDTLGRFGGDEFLLLLENIHNADQVARVADALLASFVEPFQLSGGHIVYVGCSIGISIYPEDGVNIEKLLRAADTAMYRAKERGRNQSCFYAREMSIKAVEQLEIETALRQALERDEFLVHYQPKVNLDNGRITGAEALVRWRWLHTEVIPPARFIHIAERTGLIVPIGRMVIETACRQMREWIDQGVGHIEIAINVSVQQFHLCDLGSVIRKALYTYNVNPEMLSIEITESAVMKQPEVTIAALKTLSEIGVKISLDDFGTGFSNLSYLNQFPLDVLKIDQSFVKNIGIDPTAVKIINSIIDMAGSMNLLTIAEGVETQAQLDYLKAQGCHEMQGFYFSKPVTADEFAMLVMEGRCLEFSVN